MWRPLLAVLAAALPGHASQEPMDGHIVLEPVKANSFGHQHLVLLLPGDEVPHQHYVKTAQAMQAAASELRLWVVLPAVSQNRCIVACPTPSLCSPLRQTVEEALSVAMARGWTYSGSRGVWLAGHSLGGACVNNLVKAYDTKNSTPGTNSFMPLAGIILMGSYLEEEGNYDLLHYPKPVLILNSELDGGPSRPGKTAIWWRQYLKYEALHGSAKAVMDKAVIVLPKLNHTNFCPGYDMDFDLMAEVNQTAASALIGNVVATYVQMQAWNSTAQERAAARASILKKVEWTRQLLSPYVQAQDFERLAMDTRASNEGASAFCAQAQRIIAGLSQKDSVRLDVFDNFHSTKSGLEFCRPSISDQGSRLTVHSCSHTEYFEDVSELGPVTAASEIACKMLTGESIARRLNTTQEDPSVDCRAINVYAVQVAESMASNFTLERYRRSGRGLCFLEDVPIHFGPLWALTSPLQAVDGPDCLSVASPAVKSPLDYWIFPGTYSCKLLSPARVLDWMMTDSLRPSKSSQQPAKANWLWA